MTQEGLYDRGRALRTFLMAVDMVVVPLGAVIIVASFLPSAALSLHGREIALAVGILLVAAGLVTLRLLVLSGRKVGAVYGMKGAARAGLLPGSKAPTARPPRDPAP